MSELREALESSNEGQAEIIAELTEVTEQLYTLIYIMQHLYNELNLMRMFFSLVIVIGVMYIVYRMLWGIFGWV
jgi:hypothetical protein